MDYSSLVTLVKNYSCVADSMSFIYAPVNYSYNLIYDHSLVFILLMKSRVRASK